MSLRVRLRLGEHLPVNRTLAALDGTTRSRQATREVLTGAITTAEIN